MKISEIDIMIKEYVKKLYEKVPVKIKGRKNKKWVFKATPNLRIFYEKEIKTLSRQRALINNQEEQKVTINWDDVTFEDGQIRIKLREHFSEPFSFPDSRKSLNQVKHYILRCNLKPLNVFLIHNKIIRIENVNNLYSLIQILFLHQEIKLCIEGNQKINALDVIERLNKIEVDSLVDIFRIKEKSIYLNYLCKIHDIKYKIIPVTEVNIVYDEVIREEETFIFSLKKDKTVFIIWESTSVDRATHIFKSKEVDYIAAVQLIFDFISAQQRAKRRTLRLSKRIRKNPLNYLMAIEHYNLASWKKKINNSFIN